MKRPIAIASKTITTQLVYTLQLIQYINPSVLVCDWQK